MPDPINDTIAALTAAGATDEEITSILKEKFGKQGITTGPNPDVTGITTGPQQPNAWGPGSALDTANKTPPSGPTTWGEGFRGSLNQLLTKEGINNTLKGFSSRIVPGAVNLAKAAVDPRTYVQSGGPEHQRMLEEATGTRVPTTDYGLGKATELYGTPEQIGEATGNVMMGSVLGAAAPRILPKVPDAMVTTGNFVDRNAGRLAQSAPGRFGLGGAVASMSPEAVAIAASPYAVQGAGKVLAGAGRILGGGKPRFMEPPAYPVGTPDLGPPEPPWMEPPVYPETPPTGPPPPPGATGTGAAVEPILPIGPPTPQGWSQRTTIPHEKPQVPSTLRKQPSVDEILIEKLTETPTVEPVGTTRPEPTITSSGREVRPGIEGEFQSSGRPAAPLDPEIPSTLEAAAARREAARAEPTPRRAEPAPPQAAEPAGETSSIGQQLRDSIIEQSGGDPNTVRVLSQMQGAKTTSQILKKGGVDLSEEGVRKARGDSASIFPEGPRARIDTWLAEHPNASPAEIKAYMYAKNSNVLSRTHITESLKRDGWSDAAIAELMNK